jgi:hypothetical protein
MIATATPFTGFQPIAKLGELSNGRQKNNAKNNALGAVRGRRPGSPEYLTKALLAGTASGLLGFALTC